MATQAESRNLTRMGGWIHRHAWWIVVFWVVVAGGMNIAVPQLEQIVSRHSADFVPADLPANQTLEQMAADFGVPPSNAVSSVILVDDNGFSDADADYYHRLTERLTADSDNVAYLVDLYGSEVTRDIAVSPDGKAVNMLLALDGSAGSTRADHATDAVREHIDALDRPEDLQVHLSGPTATLTDLFGEIDVSLLIITVVSVLLITLMLLVVYRDLVTALIPLVSIGITLAVVRPIVGLLGDSGALSISNFTIAIMTALVLGAGTDYAVFTIGNYHEARRLGHPLGGAVARASGRTGPILIASALTIAAACAAMIFTKIGMFTTAGPPTAIAILITLVIALTLPVALLSLAGRRGWAEPRHSSVARWQRRGARIIRHAGIYTAAALVFLVGTALITTTFRMNWDESAMPRSATDSTRGYDLAYEHYGQNVLAQEFVTVVSDHDMRNTADLAALELAAHSVDNHPDVDVVRSVTRPYGTPLAEAATGHQTGIVGERLDDAHRQISEATPELRRLAAGVDQLSSGADDAVTRLPELVSGTEKVAYLAGTMLTGLDRADALVRTAGGTSVREDLPEVRRTVRAALQLADGLLTQSRLAETTERLDGVLGPLLAAETSPACRTDPVCRSARDALSAYDRATGGRVSAARADWADLRTAVVDGSKKIKALIPQIDGALGVLDKLLAQTGGQTTDQLRGELKRLVGGTRELQTGIKTMADGLHQVKDGTDQTVELTGELRAGLQEAADYLLTMSKSTRSGPGAGFYLPEDGLRDPRFVEGAQLLMSPDGTTARMMVTWGVNPYSQEAMSATREIPGAVTQALDGTVLDDAQVATTGLAALSADMQDQVRKDFLVFAVVAGIAVLLILMVLLRSILAPVLLVATVLLSFASAIGVSVLVWQHLIGIDLDWSVIPVSFMAVIAVGADYSMLFASRIREESAAGGMARGIIRGFGSTGGVITTAGLVFAVTMFALMSGTVLNLVQIGFTIGVGLLLDIAIVRTVLVPAMMAVFGERIWWPSGRRRA